MAPLMLAVSEADPYVVLQLPTAPGTKFKTKTVTNSSHPVWNETFTFLIQSQVKVKVRVSLATHLRTGCTAYTNVLGWGSGRDPEEWGVCVLQPRCAVCERIRE